ncbi:sigma-70 family RNA polymerase sigma factor [Lacrimispora sp.]|uniref:sigma-70 family RNA polymerase sigma factor n=1 Tax=Lacrimispora sp. TaxID=2719234 RepID=UPI0028A7D945|nr:sigma-70 family RNA polymerase sigma factor [Lacrimispora sp.]
MSNEELVRQIKQGEDRKGNLALLWERNQGLIDTLVRNITGLKNYEEGFEDAKQQSYFGLLEAVKNYDPAAGVKFFSYAPHHIRKSLYRYHANCGGLVRVPEHLKNNYLKHMEYQKSYFSEHGKYPDDEACRNALGLSSAAYGILKSTENAMNQISLDSYMTDGEGKQRGIGDCVACVECLEEVVTGSVYQQELHQALHQAMEVLEPTERKIVTLHHYQGRPVSFIARLTGSSRQGIYNRLQISYQKILRSEYREMLESFLDAPCNQERIRKAMHECTVDGLDETERGLLL